MPRIRINKGVRPYGRCAFALRSVKGASVVIAVDNASGISPLHADLRTFTGDEVTALDPAAEEMLAASPAP